MRNWNAYMDVLFVVAGIDNWKNGSAVVTLLAVALVLAAAGLILWLRRKELMTSEDRYAKEGTELADEDHPDGDAVAGAIAIALGGTANIYSLRSSDTRLRVIVNDGTLVNRGGLKATGALGILTKGRQVQVFYENQVEKICGELIRYLDSHRKNDMEQEVELDYERVLKKVYAPVEGDVVCVSDIHCLQNLGGRGVGVCAIRAARGEVRAPFDCKAGYSQAGEEWIECISEEGCRVRLYIISEADTGWQVSRSIVAVRPVCVDGERVRKGRLLAEYPYDILAGRGEAVYVVLEVYADDQKYINGAEEDDGGYKLKVNRRERVNYEYVACELVI